MILLELAKISLAKALTNYLALNLQQDTVMAVEALWKMSTILQQSEQNLDLTITHSDDTEYVRRVTINEGNSLVYNSMEVKRL